MDIKMTTVIASEAFLNWLIFILEIVNGIVSPEKEVLPSADDAIDVSPVKGMSIKTDMRCGSSYLIAFKHFLRAV